MLLTIVCRKEKNIFCFLFSSHELSKPMKDFCAVKIIFIEVWKHLKLLRSKRIICLLQTILNTFYLIVKSSLQLRSLKYLRCAISSARLMTIILQAHNELHKIILTIQYLEFLRRKSHNFFYQFNIFFMLKLTAITERACEGSTLYLTCPQGQSINVTYANYGRSNLFVCPAGGQQNTNCYSGSSIQTVRNTCQGQNQCSISASDALFGDPCPRTYKYLEVDYECEFQSPPGEILCIKFISI